MQTEDRPIPKGFREYLHEFRETRDVIAWIWNDLISEEGKRQSRRMAFLFLITSSLMALQPLVFAQVVNELGTGVRTMPWLMLIAFASIVFAGFGMHWLLQVLREKAWNRNTLSIFQRVNELYGEKSLGQHLAEGDELNHSTIDRSKNRIEMLQQLAIFDIGSILVQLVFTYVLLWTFGLLVGLVSTALVLLHVGWSLYLNYKVAVATEPIERDIRAQTRQASERCEKLSRVKTSGKTEHEHNRLTSWFDEILKRDLAFWTAFIGLGKLRDGIVICTVLALNAYGTYQVSEGEWKIGQLIPLFSWTMALYSNLYYIGFAERRLSQHVPFIKSMKKALTMPPEFREGEGKTLTSTEPIGIRFKNITMAYEDGSHPVLSNISFGIMPGEKVALLGPSGAGKTTIMKLLLRFSDPTSGEIWINGSRLVDLSLPSWMEKVGYIPQQPEVFDGTIRYNMIFGLSEDRQQVITDEEIWEVMRLLKIDFGSRLTNGLETLVGRNGLKLSGGQQQRLMIGAAVIKRPIFMVIDEATSSLDSSTEKLVQKGLETVLDGPVGALIVAHRLSTVRHLCNRFLVLRPHDPMHPDTNQIEAEAGSFEELYQISPTFRQLADDQGLAL